VHYLTPVIGGTEVLRGECRRLGWYIAPLGMNYLPKVAAYATSTRQTALQPSYTLKRHQNDPVGGKKNERNGIRTHASFDMRKLNSVDRIEAELLEPH
jgi:hypothetical protein